jgi:Icc-related predicted phosphoesterase
MCALRIAHLVDVHGRFDAVADATGAIVGGRCAAHRRRYTTDGAPDQAAAAIERWRPLAPRLLAVAGNMDSPEIDERLSELGVALDARGYQLGSVGVFGVSAAPHSAAHPYERLRHRQGRLHDGARCLRRSRKERVSRPLS